MDINEYLKTIDPKELNKFLKFTSSNITVDKDVDRKVSNTTWLDMIEECIPYLDRIVRDPRRFLIQEDELVPVQQSRALSEEAMRHLARNTALIQDVRDDGMVIPMKVLNVFREETIDLYENRFIKTLIDRLFDFVTIRLNQNSDQKTYAKIHNRVKYEGIYKQKGTEIKINVSLEAKTNTTEEKGKDGHTLDERIANVRDVVASYRYSKFYETLRECSPVKSPIRRTNVILKEPNFVKAAELWEFLERESLNPAMEYEKDKGVFKDEATKNLYDLGFFIENNAINGKLGLTNEKYEGSIISKLVNDFVYSGNVNEKEFKSLVEKEFRLAKKRKEKMILEVKNKFENFIKEFDKNKKKAYDLIK